MIVVRIELWKKGNPEDVVLLGVASISLDPESLSKDQKKASYNVELSHAGKYLKLKKGFWKKGRVENHRRMLSPYHLVFKALKAALKIK